MEYLEIFQKKLEEQMNNNIITVTNLNRYIREKLDDDVILQNIYVKGEVSNLKKHNSGHIYFTLKDSKSSINVVMFKSYTYSLNFDISNGAKILVIGYISIYEASGSIQLYAENIEPLGIGILTEKFELLKKKLYDEGLFDDKFKKELPEFITSVALITSEDGAAVSDIIRTIRRRNNLIKIYLIPSKVQGKDCSSSLCNGIEVANKFKEIDVIILSRGGGSIEDLWGFNEEKLARSIFSSNIPIISAVGHEIDFTISDFVSDLRASTPTAAGEIVSEPIENMKTDLSIKIENMRCILDSLLLKKRNVLENITNSLNQNSPDRLLEYKKKELLSIKKDMDLSIDKIAKEKRHELDKLIINLKNNDPLNILDRGFSIVYKDQEVISSTDNININDKLSIRLAKGNIKCNVINKE